MSNEQQVPWGKRLVNKTTHPIPPGMFNEGQRERLESVRYGLAWLKENPHVDHYGDEGHDILSTALKSRYPELHNVDDVIKDIGRVQRDGWVHYIQSVNEWASGRKQSRR